MDLTSIFSLAGLLEVLARVGFGGTTLYAIWVWASPPDTWMPSPMAALLYPGSTELVMTTASVLAWALLACLVGCLVAPVSQSLFQWLLCLRCRGDAQVNEGAAEGAPRSAVTGRLNALNATCSELRRRAVDFLLRRGNARQMEKHRQENWDAIVSSRFEDNHEALQRVSSAEASELIMAVASDEVPQPLLESALLTRTLGEMSVTLALAGAAILIPAVLAGLAPFLIVSVVTASGFLLGLHAVYRYAALLRYIVFAVYAATQSPHE